MKKLNALVASALLAGAGSGLAVTCSQDNVPAATLLVPHFRIEATVNPDFTLGAVKVDTLLAITNVSSTGLIAHVTVWNKYSKPVYDYNIPVTGFDVVTWRMSDSVNGDLTHNSATIAKLRTAGTLSSSWDPCGIQFPSNTLPKYDPSSTGSNTGGWGKTKFIRFRHPQSPSGDVNSDVNRSISDYKAKAFGPGSAFQRIVVGSLDESANISTFTSSAGAGILDVSNYPCDTAIPAVAAGAPTVLSGYVTIDVVNYCTNFFPDQPETYTLDAIATRGWRQHPSFGVSNPGYTPNALIGDVFYVDGTFAPGAVPGNVSGDPMVGLEFDERLNLEPVGSDLYDPKTFYGKYMFVGRATADNDGPYGAAGTRVGLNYDLDWAFAGDGREPLGERFGYRFLNQSPAAVTWLLVWRSSVYRDALLQYTQVDLCDWLVSGGPKGRGFYDDFHKLTVTTYNEDEDSFSAGSSGCPSGDPTCQTNPNELYIFLETQRILLAGNDQINPSRFGFGWTDVHLKNRSISVGAGYFPYPYLSNQGWIGVQHSAAGNFVSVGHSASLLDGDFLCRPTGSTSIPTRLFQPVQVPVEHPYVYPAYSLQFNPNANLDVPRGVYSPR